LEAATRDTPPAINEHLFLALDKNVQAFPWESIPILRGRAVSRIPSLPFLLDQVALGRHLQPAAGDTQRTFDKRKVYYILNPSGDLAGTQAHFLPWLEDMGKKAGWKGITGRSPTELEMEVALKNYDLVLCVLFARQGGVGS
jgi:separase